MLSLKFIRANPEAVRAACARRGLHIDVEEILHLDEMRRELIASAESLKSKRNTVSKEVGERKKKGQDATALMDEMASVNGKIKALDEGLHEVDAKVQTWLMGVPNLAHESVPPGADDTDNVEIKTWGEKPMFNFTPREHWDLGTCLGGLDFERGVKLAGSRFVVYMDWAARLERALAGFMLDIHTLEHGYLETLPPVIANRTTLTATGQLPKFAEDLFKLEDSEYFLIPTAEVAMANLHRDEIIEEEDLPLKYTAWTGCFRSEAGSYGRDTKGLIRMHQFQKVELVRFERPHESYAALEEMLGHAEEILRRLGLHYRVVTLCGGDLGFGSTKTYDIEVWLPGQNTYREISSCSNCEDFQARRGNMRLRKKDTKKTEFMHTLNGSGLAVGRTLVAVLENYQQADGSIAIPEALQPYMGGLKQITKS